jgi:hypothetical protein
MSAVIFTEEQGLALLQNQPDVVKALSKDSDYKAFFVKLENRAGVEYIKTLESNGKFTIAGEQVSFTLLSFIAMSKMSLQSNGDYNNEEVYPEFAAIVNEAQGVLSAIEVASEGKYSFYSTKAENHKGKSSPREPLRQFVSALLRK